MIKIHYFSEAYHFYLQHKISLRLLQDQAAVISGICHNSERSISNPLEIGQSDIAWLMQQPEATQDYSDYLGGYVYVCEAPDDLLQIHGCDLEWAKAHNENWPNVTDMPVSWDACNYLDEATGDPLWAIFLLCWNDAGGPVYYVPRHLWQLARVTEHIEATNPTP